MGRPKTAPNYMSQMGPDDSLPQHPTPQNLAQQPAKGGPPLQRNGGGAGGAVPRQFPPSFGIYGGSGFSHSFVLGEHQDQPLYAVSTHTGWSSQPDVVLHNGRSDKSPSLAWVTLKAFGRGMDIDLPGGPVQIDVHGWPSTVYSFAIEVEAGPGGQLVRESFEWRHSSGEAIAGLNGAHSGWKLVRLGSGGSAGRMTSNDGNEVVAAFAPASMSMTKKMVFQFLGSAADGWLGERWNVMAVISALGVWEQARRRRKRGAGAAAAGGAGGGGGGGGG